MMEELLINKIWVLVTYNKILKVFCACTVRGFCTAPQANYWNFKNTAPSHSRILNATQI